MCRLRLSAAYEGKTSNIRAVKPAISYASVCNMADLRGEIDRAAKACLFRSKMRGAHIIVEIESSEAGRPSAGNDSAYKEKNRGVVGASEVLFSS